MQSLLYGSQRITALGAGFRESRDGLLLHFAMIATGGDSKKVDYRYSIFHRLPQPPIIRCVRLFAHERVINCFITVKDLTVNFFLVVVPDPPAWRRIDSLNRQ